MKKITFVIWFIFLTISSHCVFGAEESSSSKKVIVISSDDEEDDSKARKDTSAPVSCIFPTCPQTFMNKTELGEHLVQCHSNESLQNIATPTSPKKKTRPLRGPKPIDDLDKLSGVFYTCKLCSLNFRQTEFGEHLSEEHETNLDNYIAYIKLLGNN